MWTRRKEASNEDEQLNRNVQCIQKVNNKITNDQIHIALKFDKYFSTIGKTTTNNVRNNGKQLQITETLKIMYEFPKYTTKI